MKITEYDELYSKIYSLFRNITPLTADCGLLCTRRCCSGSETTGMFLFPGEETSLEIKENRGRRLAVCNGQCDRNSRPLSCMLFPFFPAIDENGKINVELDYRGVAVWPLIANNEEVLFNRRFLINVRKAGKMLIKDEKCKKFIEEISEEIKEAKELYFKLIK